MISNANNSLYGLVLAGGKSTRMGADKGSLEWHGSKQRSVVAHLLNQFCEKVYISCRPEQVAEINSEGFETISDAFEGIGPYGALMSAFQFKENVAWFVIACDLPLINAESISYLISHRDIFKVATTYTSPHDNLPEPLITIWEPNSYQILKSRYEEGKTCPRKALIDSDIKIIEALDANCLINANTPKDMVYVKKIIDEKRLAEI